MKKKKALKKVKFNYNKNYILASVGLFIGSLLANYLFTPSLRDYVAPKVVKISNYEETTGGTGFFVELPSGKTGILTNAHVCKLSKQTSIYIISDDYRKIPANIIEISEETDLCLLSAFGNEKGLKVDASPLKKGEVLHSIGHPALLPTTMTSGEYTDVGQIDIAIEMLITPDQMCSGRKQIKKEFNTFFGLISISICVETYDVLFTSIPSFPGNSGSPIVDDKGNVRGICFAGDSRINWAILLDAQQIQTFLAPY